MVAVDSSLVFDLASSWAGASENSNYEILSTGTGNTVLMIQNCTAMRALRTINVTTSLFVEFFQGKIMAYALYITLLNPRSNILVRLCFSLSLLRNKKIGASCPEEVCLFRLWLDLERHRFISILGKGKQIVAMVREIALRAPALVETFPRTF